MPNTFIPQRFVEKWARTELTERASYQEHFMDLCRLVGHPTPAEKDPTGEFFTFEAGVKKTGGEQGYADVWYRGHFAIEYKGKGKHPTLEAAYQQLLQYRENLANPPLLIVCDIENWEIHTNFTGTAPSVEKFANADIATSNRVRRMLRWLFEDPNQFHPGRTVEQVTAEAADVFRDIASNMRGWQAAPERIGHFLTKLVFCLFAEDIGLLPTTSSGRGVFSEIIAETRTRPSAFKRNAEDLFAAMKDGGSVLLRDIPWFNGGLFDDVAVEDLSAEALDALDRASRLDWSAIEPAIFGTLFERSLDPSKRAQLGAHYTSSDDIKLIVEPVLMEPLRREWAAIQAEAAPIRACYDEALETSTRAAQARLGDQLNALRERILEPLRAVTVLDPACGSGNFLYVALQLLKNLEKEVITSPLFANLTLALPEVHPRQLYGIEKDQIAHDLASIVVWIGYLQWLDSNGYPALFKRQPILDPLDNIYLMDAILAYDADGNPVEPEWPSADVIVSNPPFLGGKRLRSELGDTYVDEMFRLWDGCVPREADLVTYWFEKARTAIARGAAKRVGLLATNSIRGGANRVVLQRIKETGDIFMAWSDRPWILAGAAVRVSMVGFDDGEEAIRRLNGESVPSINSDLTSSVDITIANGLTENRSIAFQGVIKTGAFDIPADVAIQMMKTENTDTRFQNADVIRPLINGIDITRRPRNMHIIDFGVDASEDEARLYTVPYSYLEQHVKQNRANLREENRRDRWWLHQRPRPEMRDALVNIERYICTPRVAKYRLFTWLTCNALPDSATIAIARDDDYFFGVLHSKLHEVWSLRMGTWLGKGNDPRYTPTTTFETFPFPWPPSQEPLDHPAYIAISEAARQLSEERDVWLNPPGVPESRLKDRTLTNLYNALQKFGETGIPEIGSFAPRLAELHDALDRGVCDAYGWEYDILDDEEEILRRLLALNLERAADQLSQKSEA